MEVLAGGLPAAAGERAKRRAGEIFVQKDLAATLRKLVEAEKQALTAGKTRKQAIYAAYDRFYKGDIAQEIVRGVREDGGLFTMEDLANWKVKIEEPLPTTYKGITVYKLPQWQQGPAMLQALNILENTDVKAMGYNSPKYIHTIYQAMNLAFADRDFYYGDPAFPPEEPVKGLLSKEYAKERFAPIDWIEERPQREARRSVSVPGRHESVRVAARRVEPERLRAQDGDAERPAGSPAGAIQRSMKRFTPARRRSRRRTRKAGSCR